MSEPVQRQTRFKSRNLLGVLAFLRKYPGRVTICLSMLLINLGIDVSKVTIPDLTGRPQYLVDGYAPMRELV